MAKRPVYVPDFDGQVLVQTRIVEFQWHPGLALSQKQKSIESLHESARAQLGGSAYLEISSKSPNPLGTKLSAFNLTVRHPASGRAVPVECAFQASKMFEDGGPYTDLLMASPRDAKRDPRLRNGSRLIGFQFGSEAWPTEPQTSFYDWLYVSALQANPEQAAALDGYAGFTDIEFNPDKSINCQAYSAALYRSLTTRGLIDEAMRSRTTFLEVTGRYAISNARQDAARQPNLF